MGVLDIVPGAGVAGNIAASQVVSGASFTLAASTGTTAVTLNGTAYIDLGVARQIQAVGAGAATASTLLTIAGLDQYRQPMTQTFTGPAATATVQTTKAFRYVGTATAAGNTVSGVSLGTNNVFGLPFRADSFNYVDAVWIGNRVTGSGGFTAADTTSPATALTGDVRGTYSVSSTPTSTSRLTSFIYIANPDTITGVYGVTQV
jgi:hypothetical protein